MAAGYLIAPTIRETSFPADFEWRLPRNATFSAASGGGPVFSTNVLRLFFQGNDVNFAPKNFAPTNTVTSSPWISYTNVSPQSIPGMPWGQLAISLLANGNVAVIWDVPGDLADYHRAAGKQSVDESPRGD